MGQYHRTKEQKSHDFAQAREYEQHVADSMPVPVITRFDSKTDLDIWIPGFFLEVKEKNQKYTQRWQDYVPWIPEPDLFIMDELTVRRSLKDAPYVAFLIRDRVTGRMFFAPLWELITVHRARVDRVGKGKWLIDMTEFRQITSEDEAHSLMIGDLTDVAWQRSECISEKAIPQV